MSLFSIETAPVPLDAETYIGEKRDYTQIILETELIALTETNYVPLTQAQISLRAKIGYMYYCEYAHLLKKHTEHTCMSAIYYDQGSDIKVKQCKTIVTFDTIPESKILDTSDLLILSNLQKPWTIACKDVSQVFEIEYSTYRILNRSELCECSLMAGNYLLSYTNTNCGDAPEARDSYFTTYYAFNKIVLDIITEKFDIQVDENTQTQAALLHDDIPGYDLPTIDFVQTSEDDDEDVSILEEDNPQIYAHLNNVLVHIIDKQEAAIFKSKQDFNRNKEKISEYIKYAENWQVISIICSYATMACDVLLIVTMIIFFDDLTHITDDYFEIKLIARLLNQIYVVQPPMLPPRYDDAPPGEYKYSQPSTSIGGTRPSAPWFPEHFTFTSYPSMGTRYGYMVRIYYKDVL